MTIRALEKRDFAPWLGLWNGYLAYYKESLSEDFSTQLFERLLTGEPHFAFVAEKNAALIGFVHCLPHASTWNETGYLYLEDLFVAPIARGTGAGRALIEAVYAEADKRGLSRVYWHTESTNKTARQLYDNLATLSNFVQYRRR